MIFNNLQKRSPNPRSAVLLRRLSTASNGDATNEDLQTRPQTALSHAKAGVFRHDDFVFLSDNINCWVVRTSEISLLEAYGNYTRVHLDNAIALIRRPLRECEGRLDSSIFFRTRRDCIVNLNRVKELRVFDAKRFLLILSDGKEIPMSRKQSLLFRRTKTL